MKSGKVITGEAARRPALKTGLAWIAIFCISLAACPIPVEAVVWDIGDVFVGGGDGTYEIYDNTGIHKETIDHGDGGQNTGCAFNPVLDKFYGTNFANTQVVVFDDAHPHPIVQIIDTAATSPNGRTESIVFAANGDFYVGHPDGNADVHKYNSAGVLQQTYDVATELRGSDWIDLAADQKTLFYTSEGSRIMRYDLSGTGTQLSDFATLPPGNAYALRLLPPGDGSGGLIVANWENIKRLDGSGNIIQTYDVPGEDNWFAMNLDPNGTSFWSGGIHTANLYRFNIATGAVEIGPINIGAGAEIEGIGVKGEHTAALYPLNLSKDDGLVGGECKYVGEHLTYNICFDHLKGVEAIYNVVMVDDLPAGTSLASASHGGIYDPGTHTITWDIGTVPAGKPQQCAQVEVRIDEPGTLELVNTVTIEGMYEAGYVTKSVVVEETQICGIILTYPPDGSVAYLTPTFRWISALGTNEAYVIDFLVRPGGRTYTTEVLTKPYWKLPHEYWMLVPSESQIYWRIRGADLDQKPLVIVTSEPWSITKY